MAGVHLSKVDLLMVRLGILIGLILYPKIKIKDKKAKAENRYKASKLYFCQTPRARANLDLTLFFTPVTRRTRRTRT